MRVNPAAFLPVLAIVFAAMSLLLSSVLHAAPYIPRDDRIVLEHLPFKPNDPIAREIATLRAALQQHPQDQALAVKLGWRYYGLVAEDGDPRYLGYAQAALAPWWDLPTPPLEVQVLRASLRQFRHDFAGALADLDQVLERQPRQGQARSLRATIHIVQARYAAARQDCEVLRAPPNELVGYACLAKIDGLTGHATAADADLSARLQKQLSVTPEQKLWVLTRLAELAQRLGHTTLAEARYREALNLGISDTFLLAAYADFLLDQQRAQDAYNLLKDKVRSDVLLLRLVFAAARLHTPDAASLSSTLADRYAAAQLRGDTVHQQEEARFTLQLQHDAQKALGLAQANWQVQREPRDARIFLEAALAARNRVAAGPVLDWVASSHIEDAYLIGLVRQIKALP